MRSSAGVEAKIVTEGVRLKSQGRYRYMTSTWRALLAAYLLLVIVVLLFLWLATGQAGLIRLSPEFDFAVLGVAFGGLGSTAFAILSLIDLRRKHRLFDFWKKWYLLYPFAGMAAGLVAYLFVRVGLVKFNQVSALHSGAIAVLSALSGFWMRHLLRTLKQQSDKRARLKTRFL